MVGMGLQLIRCEMCALVPNASHSKTSISITAGNSSISTIEIYCATACVRFAQRVYGPVISILFDVPICSSVMSHT